MLSSHLKLFLAKRPQNLLNLNFGPDGSFLSFLAEKEWGIAVNSHGVKHSHVMKHSHGVKHKTLKHHFGI